MRGGADASQADQAIYLRTLVNALNAKGYNYFCHRSLRPAVEGQR